MERYIFLDHTADFKFQAFGSTLEEALSNAAIALTDVVIEQNEVEEAEKRSISVESEDNKSLLYDFLEKILYLMETDHFVIASVDSLKIERGKKMRLTASFSGDIGIENHDYKRAVKAMTYNEMLIDETPGKCMVQVVVDL